MCTNEQPQQQKCFVYIQRKPIVDNGLEFPTMQSNVAPYMKLTRTGQLQVERQPFRGALAFYEDLMARSTNILNELRANKLSQSRKTEL